MEDLKAESFALETLRPEVRALTDFATLPVLGVKVVAIEQIGPLQPEVSTPLELNEIKCMAGVINRATGSSRKLLSEEDRRVFDDVRAKTREWKRTSRIQGYTIKPKPSTAFAPSEDTTENSFVSISSGSEPLLTKKGEYFLGKSYIKAQEEGDIAEAVFSRNMLINSNLRLVVSTVAKYPEETSITFADYVQEGNLGLEHAVDKFNPEKGFKFSTYASWWIKQYVNRFIRRQSTNIRLPCDVYSSVKTLRRQCTEAGLDLLTSGVADIAEKTGVAPEEVVRLYDASVVYGTVSLDKTIGSDGNLNTLGSTLADPKSSFEYDIDNKIRVTELLEQLKEAGFTPQQIDQIWTKYFNDTGDTLTYSQVGRHCGKTGQAVGALTRRALRRIEGMDFQEY